MGLRSRVKDGLRGSVKRLLGRDTPGAGETSPAGHMPATAATPVVAPAVVPAAPAVVPAAPAMVPAAPPPAAAAHTRAVPKPTPVVSDEEAERKEKTRKHLLKTKQGMLRWLDQQGGQSPMGPMHDYCERRFFVAHRGFSNLMEELTEGGLVLYEGDSGTVTLTEAGRAWTP